MNGISPISSVTSVFPITQVSLINVNSDVKIKQLQAQKEIAELQFNKQNNDSKSVENLKEKINKLNIQIENLQSDKSSKINDTANLSELSNAEKKRRFDSFECSTCENRKYQDVSDDSSVSFQTPTKINPDSAEAAVRSHENEHVTANQAKAAADGNEIVSQSVSIQHAVCPECGDNVVTGGLTKTVIKSNSYEQKFSVGLSDSSQVRGKSLNIVA